ncbi:4'-phosphopantetheinyl transferase superfamily protein [Pontiellaceae bacterium B12227]|nr:4'-phosphopantetheinyl transferase superfamily protein [Pontiellaceae bacterium B12227]
METVEYIENLPMLGNNAIHIWGAEVPMLGKHLHALKALLNGAEVAKADRFLRDGDRYSSIVARGALRVLLSGYTGISAKELIFQYTENGKPFLVSPASSRLQEEQGRQDACDTVSFNVSHSGDWVVLAFGRNRDIGVDVEKIRREMDVMSIASRYFTPEESALIEASDDVHRLFFHHWARKEAYIKAIGSALFRELSSFAVPNEDEEKEGWFFQRLEAGSKYASAVVTDKPIEEMPCFDFGGLKWDS